MSFAWLVGWLEGISLRLFEEGRRRERRRKKKSSRRTDGSLLVVEVMSIIFLTRCLPLCSQYGKGKRKKRKRDMETA